MLFSGKALSERLALTLNVTAPESTPRRYSTAVAEMLSNVLSHTAARLTAAMPNIFFTRSNASSICAAAVASCGSAYMVLCALYTLKSPRLFSLRRMVFTRMLSNVARFRPFSAISPW